MPSQVVRSAKTVRNAIYVLKAIFLTSTTLAVSVPPSSRAVRNAKKPQNATNVSRLMFSAKKDHVVSAPSFSMTVSLVIINQLVLSAFMAIL